MSQDNHHQKDYTYRITGGIYKLLINLKGACKYMGGEWWDKWYCLCYDKDLNVPLWFGHLTGIIHMRKLGRILRLVTKLV